MSSRFKVTFNDSEDLGFAKSAYTLGAISFDELKEWIVFVISEEEEVPSFFFDILDIKEADRAELTKSRIYGGFSPHWSSDLDKQDALIGISVLRGRHQAHGDYRKEILCILERNPDVSLTFKRLFPFIDLPES